MLLEMLSKDLITLRHRPLRYTTSPGDRPRVSPLIKLQTETQTQVTTLAHGMMQLSDLSKRLVPMLDGGHDRAALRDHLRDLVTQGKLVIEQFVKDPADAVPDEVLDELLESEIDLLARNATLLKDDDSSTAVV